ncbi:MAG: thioredoxin-disulfide reductase [Candidatus Pacebacteria bacterium]|nr:thioredoxin-disulfide reductase [Candidatus Paceibacterota bacterium]
MQESNLVIIGSGPAGYTAALYAARAQLAPVVFTGIESGGQLMYTTLVENFPGFVQGEQGPKLMMAMRQQAARFGAQIKDQTVTGVDLSQAPFKIWTNFPEGTNPEVFKQGDSAAIQQLSKQVKQQQPSYQAKAVIIATGAVSIMLGIPGEQELIGKGVSTCAVCDAAFYRDKKVFVIGGGDSAMEDTLALSKFTDQVTVIHRRDQFRASKIMQDRVLNNNNIKVLWHSNLKEVIGQDKVEKIKVDVNGELQEFAADGVFLAIGHRPVSDLFNDQLQIDQKGYVVTRQSLTVAGVTQAQQALDDQGLVTFPSMTSQSGVFAAGDVVDVRYKQAVTAAGQGCTAALDAERWLESH